MSIDIISINGKSPYFDYEKFELTFKEQIGKKCADAKVFIFNNFPISVSTESDIDLILIMAIEFKKGNYYIPKVIDNKPVFFSNQIIPIKFITHFQKRNITAEGKALFIEDEEFLDLQTEATAIRNGLTNYLAYRCNFKRKELYVRPLIFIQNKNEVILDNCIVGPNFDFKCLHQYFSQNSADIFISYKDWRTTQGFAGIASDIEQIVNQASKDCEIGYLTKKKIDRISRQLSSSKTIFEELNKQLVIISGKAGTGKSSELLLLVMRCINNGKNTLYLTYNKLLTYDIAKTVKSYIHNKRNMIDYTDEIIGQGSVLTLHSFFHRLSRSLGVLHVLSEERITTLLRTLKERMRAIYNFINTSSYWQARDYEQLKTAIQNHSYFNIGTKEVGIDFINFLQKSDSESNISLNSISIEYYNNKKRLIENISTNEVFLADYYGVLENTLLAIQQPQQYFEKYNIREKFELLEVVLRLQEKHIEKDGDTLKINLSGFKEQKNRSVGAYRRKRTVFIDEAQDCHRLEKDILLSIYGSDNIVVANGGKEQLIRHVELCNWEVSQGKKLDIKKHVTRNTSFRVKKTVVDFCNFVASKYHINLNLVPIESEDEGELLFDFRTSHGEKEISEVFSLLRLTGQVNGCTPYESLLVLLESSSQRIEGFKKENDNQNSASINRKTAQDIGLVNEYGNIESNIQLKRGTWKHVDTLSKQNMCIWDGTTADKSQLSLPVSNESRLIYYESCRGLESWSVACFALDKFFKIKVEDPDAERYLIENMFLTNEQRKNMFAATWILMAMTRAIDTLYIQINDRNSTFGRVVDEYLQQNNKNVRELG